MKTQTFIFIFSLSMFSILSLVGQDMENTNDWSSTPIEITGTQLQKAIVIRAEVAMPEIGNKMGEVFQILYSYVQENEIVITGPPFSIYYKWDTSGTVVFESGLPVSENQHSEGNIMYKEYPSMQTVSTVYTGSYQNLTSIYAKLTAYLNENNLQSTGISWEIYLTNPDETPNPSENKTQILFPIKN